MGRDVSPVAVEIVNVVDEDNNDDDDDLSVLYATPVSSKTGTNSNNAISVEEYSWDKDLHLAIMASLFENIPNTSKPKRVIDLSQDYYRIDLDDDFQVRFPKTRNPFRGISITEHGQSSNSKPDEPTFMCEICVEPKPSTDSFAIKGCTHNYCSECMAKYVASKLQDNISQITCPVSGCQGLLEPEHCRSILPPEVFDRWGNALCEAVILVSDKFYCPFNDCSTMLINDIGKEIITQSECPDCRRLFCAQCKVPWHSGIICAEFQKLDKDERKREDIMLMNLAKNNKWMRCPKCRFYVERSQGCLFMRCRCGHSFCYNCGALMTGQSHYCSNCKR